MGSQVRLGRRCGTPPRRSTKFGVPSESRVLSAHRTPKETAEYVTRRGRPRDRGAHRRRGRRGAPGRRRRRAHVLPVLGVPMESASLKGLDSLLSTVQMPGGIPVATLAIGKPGAVNAALFAVAILAGKRPELAQEARRLPRRAGREDPAGEAAVAARTCLRSLRRARSACSSAPRWRRDCGSMRRSPCSDSSAAPGSSTLPGGPRRS